MSKINVRDLRPGMKLSSDVVGNNGRLLLVKGTLFDEKKIRVLNIWGVTDVDIQGVDKHDVEVSAMSQFDELVFEECKQRLMVLFGAVNLKNEFMSELFNVSLQWCAMGAQGDVSPSCALKGNGSSKHSPGKFVSEGNIPSLTKVIAKGQKFMSMPTAYFRIVEALKNPYCSAGHLAGIVEKDIGLSARLLKVVNSPAFGVSKSIDSISRGITIVGFKELSELVLGVTVVGIFQNACSTVLNMYDFWKHSMACGIVARILASHRPGISEERMFIAGMLHDIGRLAILMTYPESLNMAIQLAKASTFPLHEVELTQFGFSHADVGGELLQGWKLPPGLVDIIRYHHSPVQAENSREASLLCVADCMATAFQFGSSGNAYLPNIDMETWEPLGMPLSVLDTVRNQAGRQVNETLRAFFE